MSVQQVHFTDANFDAESRKGVCVVCFEEPTDHDCRKQVKNIERAADEFTEKIKVGPCDVETCSALAKRFCVTSIPTTIILKNGEEVERLVGHRHETTLVKHLRKDVGQGT